MVNDDLHAALGRMVEQHGFKVVARSLREIEAKYGGQCSEAEAQRPSRPKAGRRVKQRLSAVDYVQAIEVPADQAAVIRRAAEEFERGAFLPRLGDIREFCGAFGITEPKSKSRSSEIPRIFKFLVTLEVADVEKILDERLFSGPARLGPIADAIRGRAREYHEAATDRA